MLVKDFMMKEAVCIKESETIKVLLEKLVEKRIGGAPVTNEQGKLVGIISDGDILRLFKPKSQRIYDFFYLIISTDQETLDHSVEEKLNRPVKEVMTKGNVFYVQMDDPLEKALSIISNHHFKKIPVIDDEWKVVGVVSRGDVIRQLTKMFILKND